MNIIKSICLVLIVAISLTGCTIKKPPQNLQIKADGGFDPKSVGFSVESSLPKNAKLQFLIKDDDLNKTIYQTTLNTDEEGSAEKKFSFDIQNRNLTAILLFNPLDQSKEIQSKYGEYGQNIRKNAIGYKAGKKNQKNFAYIKLYGTFYKFGSMSRHGNLIFGPKKLKLE